MAALSALLRAVILAACVAGAIAGAPSEEWAERLRLLESRVEQSEQREAEQLRLFETRVGQSKQREAALHKRVAFLEGEVQRLRPSSEQAEATAPKARTGKAAVGPMGEPEAVGRRLSAPTCCRWTADGTCGTVIPAERFEVCTHMHEYLETKTTTHEFADLDSCLGPDASKWSAKFDGAIANVTLSYDAAVTATLKTPLKVTHAADCGNVPPTLALQMDTTVVGDLTVSGSIQLRSPPVIDDANLRVATGPFGLKYGTYTLNYEHTAWAAADGNKLQVTAFADAALGDGGKFFYAEPLSPWCVTLGCAFSIRLSTKAENGFSSTPADLGTDIFVHSAGSGGCDAADGTQLHLWRQPSPGRSNCLFRFADAGSGLYSLQVASYHSEIEVMCDQNAGVCNLDGNLIHFWTGVKVGWTLIK